MATIETDGARSNIVHMCLCASLSLWIHLANRYSACTVLSASWNVGTTSDPHVIELAAEQQRRRPRVQEKGVHVTQELGVMSLTENESSFVENIPHTPPEPLGTTPNLGYLSTVQNLP
jgi:hypothetical protein